MANERTLYGRTSDNITLPDALVKCAECFAKDTVGLFYSVSACKFGKIEGNLVKDEATNIIDLEEVFEARIFNNAAELRWLNDLGGKGKAVLLSERENQNYLDRDIESLQAIDVIDSYYLLWGEGSTAKTSDPNWSYLSTARIGKLAVPIPSIQKHQRVKLLFREYLQEWDENGNVVVVEERLKGAIAIPVEMDLSTTKAD